MSRVVLQLPYGWPGENFVARLARVPVAGDLIDFDEQLAGDRGDILAGETLEVRRVFLPVAAEIDPDTGAAGDPSPELPLVVLAG